jgi:prefoldin subunit 4
MRSHVAQGGGVVQEVTKEDQESINAFSKLNAKNNELGAQLLAKKVRAQAAWRCCRVLRNASNSWPILQCCTQKLLEDLEDAGNEVMLSDEVEVRYVVGECFVHLPHDAAEMRLSDMSTTVGADVEALNGQISDVQAQMKALKAKLYSKFGSSIQL